MKFNLFSTRSIVLLGLILVFIGLSQVSVAADNKANAVKLSTNAIENLQINAGFGWGIFSGSIYNSNHDVTIKQLIVMMTPIHDHHMEMMGTMSHEPKEYVIDLNLKPLSKSAISVAIAADDTHVHDFEWEIIQALGYK